MLQLTSNAIAAIAALAERQERPGAAGLRIARTEDGSAMTATPAVDREAEERVVEQNGVRVYLTPAAADSLVDKVLDAQVDDSGRIGFYVAPQPPRPAR